MVILFMRFFHIITAIWFISGLLGRTLTMWQASKVSEIQLMIVLVHLAGYFERWMVIPGSMAAFGFGLVTASLQYGSLTGFLKVDNSYWLLISICLFLSMMPIIRFVFIHRGKVFEKTLAEAASLGKVTSALTAAFHDQAVRAAHIYELAVTLVIIFLMIIKPF